VNKRVERQRRIEDALRDFRFAIGNARAVAAAQHQRATEVHARDVFEFLLRAEGVDRALADPSMDRALHNPVLHDLLRQVLAEREQHFAQWTESGPAELAALVAEAAPGVAGAADQGWLGRIGAEDGTGELPALWRIGTARTATGPGAQDFPVAIPLLDTAHLHLTTVDADGRAAAETVVETLLLRVLTHLMPGLLQIHVWDTGQLTGSLPGLYPLTRAGLLTVHDPARPQELLDELSEHIRRVHTGVLTGGHTSVRAITGGPNRRTEPWRIAVLFGDRSALGDEQQQQLQRMARNGLACGVQLVVVDVPLTRNAPMETVEFGPGGVAHCSMTGEDAVFRPDPALPRAEVPNACAEIAAELEARRARLCTFDDLMPAGRAYWRESSAGQLTTPVGYTDGLPVDLVLGDSSPHALIGGPSGSGKTNFLYAALAGLTARYSPDELELYLLDFKEGVSFAQFAPGRRDQTWLPHARLVGVNVNEDREFGLALLNFLAEEMRSRAEAAKRHEVTKLEELRAEDPKGRWPRIVAVIDEFQYLFSGEDAVAKQAAQVLEDVARRGRSQGIHLVLASQDVSGIKAFWGRPAIFEQFSLRVALPKARRVLADLNDAAVELPRFHAVLNHESGVRPGNLIARIPDATRRGTFDELQVDFHRHRNRDQPAPRLFDGSLVPPLSHSIDFRTLRPGEAAPIALYGQVIDVAGSAAGSTLANSPGRNLAVLGSVPGEAVSVLGAAALSLARQHKPGDARFTLCPLIGEVIPDVDELAEQLRAMGQDVSVVDREDFRDLLGELAAELADRRASGTRGQPHYLFGYAVDSAAALLEKREPGQPAGIDDLRAVLRHGPEHRTHVLGWWRGVSRLKASLPMGAGQTDDIGAWVAFDVQGPELSGFASGQLITWSPRPGRALYFDRFTHARPEVIIPFAIDRDATGWRTDERGGGPGGPAVPEPGGPKHRSHEPDAGSRFGAGEGAAAHTGGVRGTGQPGRHR
jgi:hypothetical protein